MQSHAGGDAGLQRQRLRTGTRHGAGRGLHVTVSEATTSLGQAGKLRAERADAPDSRLTVRTRERQASAVCGQVRSQPAFYTPLARSGSMSEAHR